MEVYLGLGTNIGNKRKNLITAAALLAEKAGDVMALSAFYETEPWGFHSDNSFLNAALCLQTDLSPEALLAMAQEIERAMGRKEKSSGGSYSDRIIDIDLLLYGDRVVKRDGLEIPHPMMTQRRFVLEPLVEIAPFVKHPVLDKSMEELLNDLDEQDKENTEYGQK